jgi:hypothetical protein
MCRQPVQVSFGCFAALWMAMPMRITVSSCSLRRSPILRTDAASGSVGGGRTVSG